jgi:hypothetical protein
LAAVVVDDLVLILDAVVAEMAVAIVGASASDTAAPPLLAAASASLPLPAPVPLFTLICVGAEEVEDATGKEEGAFLIFRCRQ